MRLCNTDAVFSNIQSAPNLFHTHCPTPHVSKPGTMPEVVTLVPFPSDTEMSLHFTF